MIFRYSGKTEFQTTQLNKARRTVQFERRPSQRFAKRPAKPSEDAKVAIEQAGSTDTPTKEE